MNPQSDRALLLRQYEWIDAALGAAGAHAERVAPAVSGWSALHHIAHLALANELVLRNVHSLQLGAGMLVQRGGEPVPGALALLAAGAIPRGQAQSPRIVRPPQHVDRALLRGWLDDARAGFDALAPATIAATEFKVPHQILGPLDAPQWLRFAAVHTQHHLGIAREVLTAVGCATAELAAL
jgi:hypothetical protein